jgi:ParB-like chromosome segregation protein Spo0J
VKTLWLPVERIRPRPDAADRRMSAARRRSLREQIARSGLYPALIVRPLPRAGDDAGGGYELIDGHQRLAVLRELGWERARCELWRVEAFAALVLTATMQELAAPPCARLRAERTCRLVDALGEEAARGLLALTPSAMRQRRDLLGRRREGAEAASEAAPARHAVMFHLDEPDAHALRRAMEGFAGAGGRSAALMRICRAAMASEAGGAGETTRGSSGRGRSR